MKIDTKICKKSEVILFQKSKDDFGEFSNMHMGFPFLINDQKISCVEALYQALKFNEYPTIQREILIEKSPMAMKFKSRKYKDFVRNDWDMIKAEVMELCVRIKFYSYASFFIDFFGSTEGKYIVEYSKFDSYWGMKPINQKEIMGQNCLGEIIMKIRNELEDSKTNFDIVDIPKSYNLCLLESPIYEINVKKHTFVTQEQLVFIPEQD